jgi:hypothetical protein
LNGPQLALLAGRGSVRRAWDRRDLAMADLRAWQRGLLETLQLDSKDYASAPVSALAGDDTAEMASMSSAAGNAERPHDGYWLHAELVHFAAGLDQLTFLPLTGPAAVTVAERQALAPLIADHLRAASLRLQVSATNDWFVHAPGVLEMVTASPDAAVANELQAVMPSGTDAGKWRRMMTEWQMLLHEHPVNERRQRQGLPAINAIWPWGGGVLKSVAQRALPVAYANTAFVGGLYRMHGTAVHAVPVNGAALIEQITRPQQTLVVVDSPDLAALERDWIAPLVGALRTKRVSRLDLILDEWHVRTSRAMLRRFWRKPLPLSRWPL